MWMGDYQLINLLGLFIQSALIENFLLSLFLGMCTYLACSKKVSTANGLGLAVIFVLTLAGLLNWLVRYFITSPGALGWLGFMGIDLSGVDLSFLQFIQFISVIAAFVQVLEIVIEKFSPALYNSLGSYLPLITVNCAILGACLWSATRDYPFIPNLVYVFGAGVGWWLAIACIAAIREKLVYSNIVPGMHGMGITFVMTGLMSMAFLGFTGIKLAEPSGGKHQQIEQELFEEQRVK